MCGRAQTMPLVIATGLVFVLKCLLFSVGRIAVVR